MSQTRIKPMVESGILSAVAILFAIISAYVPVLGAFVSLIWPVPLVLLGARHGHKWSIMATVVSGIITAMLLHPLHAVSVVVGFSLTGIVLGLCIRKGLSAVKTLAFGSLASLISKAAVIAIGMLILGTNPLSLSDEAMTKALEQVMGMYRSIGMKEEELVKTTEMMKATIDLMKVILPAGFAIAAVFETWLNFTLARAVLRKLGHQFVPFPAFKYWTFPKAALYIWAIMTGLSAYGKIYHYEMLVKVALNIQLVAMVVLIAQGLAVFYFLADKYNLSRLVRNIILFLAFSNGLLTQVIVFGGAFDLIFDYRKLKESRPT